MTVDRSWMTRNLGFDPMTQAAPPETFAIKALAAAHAAPAPLDLQRELIDFDSEGPEGRAFFAFSKATGMSRYVDVAWPEGLGPTTDAIARKGKDGALPHADVLIVTWTVDEGHALSRVLTPGKDSRNDYLAYTHNFDQISKKMRHGCPALEAGRLGAYWTGKIGKKTVLVFKSDSHLSQDTKTAPKAGETLPNEDVWRQIVNEVRPSMVITTGTAGGIGPDCEVGDVVVSSLVSFDCQKWLKAEPFHATSYDSKARLPKHHFDAAQELFNANASQLPADNARPPKILLAQGPGSGVLTTDFFGFDTSDNHYGLQKLGAVSEMGDAVLGLLASRADAPLHKAHWFAVRNVSDPQIKAEGTLAQQANAAAQIYKAYGRWSTVCSAIVCWALVAG